MYPNAKFLTSAVEPGGYPRHGRVEVALAGRSNVGKSSLVNAVVGLRQFARVGKRPGRTQSINFFALDDALCLVDLPGYGYAEVPRSVRESWGPMIETYLGTRTQLQAVWLLVDARHGPSADDLLLWEWLASSHLARLVVATKWDKLKKNERRRRVGELARTLEAEPVPFSATSGEGRDALVARLREVSPG